MSRSYKHSGFFVGESWLKHGVRAGLYRQGDTSGVP